MYNAKNATEGKDKTQLTPDSILDGVIINITDGKVRDFINPKALNKWEGNKEGCAIALDIEVKDNDHIVKIEQVFTYMEDEQGNTMYTPKSNLGKYKTKYSKLPEAGDQIKIITNGDGFGKVKIE